MKTTVIAAAILLVLAAVTVHAKREAPKKVEPVAKAGIRYEAPNNLSRTGMVEAWDEKSGKKLWERIVYEVKIDPALEEDVQWDFIARLKLDGDTLLVTAESGQEYRLNLKTRKVEKVKKDQPPANPSRQQP